MAFLQQPGFDIIAQFLIGYILPGKPIANLLFKIYGRISTVHALSFLSDLKLGHYMKIPPRCMYTAQVFSSQKVILGISVSVSVPKRYSPFLRQSYVKLIFQHVAFLCLFVSSWWELWLLVL